MLHAYFDDGDTRLMMIRQVRRDPVPVVWSLTASTNPFFGIRRALASIVKGEVGGIKVSSIQ